MTKCFDTSGRMKWGLSVKRSNMSKITFSKKMYSNFLKYNYFLSIIYEQYAFVIFNCDVYSISDMQAYAIQEYLTRFKSNANYVTNAK